MEASRKKRYRRWAHRVLMSVISSAFIGFFVLVWQVHAFDVEKELPEAGRTVLVEPPQRHLAAARPTDTATPENTRSSPDRWSEGDVVAALSGFYQTIITFMGLLLGVIGILAVLTLRFLSRSAAEDMAHESAKEAMRHYLETRQFGDNVEFALQETGLADQLERLEKDLEDIKLLLRRQRNHMADEEDVEGEVTLDPNGGDG